MADLTLLASAEFFRKHEQGDYAVRNCWIRNDLWIEGLDVEAVLKLQKHT